MAFRRAVGLREYPAESDVSRVSALSTIRGMHPSPGEISIQMKRVSFGQCPKETLFVQCRSLAAITALPLSAGLGGSGSLRDEEGLGIELELEVLRIHPVMVLYDGEVDVLRLGFQKYEH